MKEKKLIDLGFERTDVKASDSGDTDDWHYYTYDFGNGSFSLISPASSDVDDEWYVEVFEDPTIKIYHSQDLNNLIDILNRNSDR